MSAPDHRGGDIAPPCSMEGLHRTDTHTEVRAHAAERQGGGGAEGLLPASAAGAGAAGAGSGLAAADIAQEALGPAVFAPSSKEQENEDLQRALLESEVSQGRLLAGKNSVTGAGTSSSVELHSEPRNLPPHVLDENSVNGLETTAPCARPPPDLQITAGGSSSLRASIPGAALLLQPPPLGKSAAHQLQIDKEFNEFEQALLRDTKRLLLLLKAELGKAYITDDDADAKGGEEEKKQKDKLAKKWAEFWSLVSTVIREILAHFNLESCIAQAGKFVADQKRVVILIEDSEISIGPAEAESWQKTAAEILEAGDEGWTVERLLEYGRNKVVRSDLSVAAMSKSTAAGEGDKAVVISGGEGSSGAATATATSKRKKKAERAKQKRGVQDLAKSDEVNGNRQGAGDSTAASSSSSAVPDATLSQCDHSVTSGHTDAAPGGDTILCESPSYRPPRHQIFPAALGERICKTIETLLPLPVPGPAKENRDETRANTDSLDENHAKQRRQRLLDMTRTICWPANPVDVLLDRFGGPERVAEITGRHARWVRTSYLPSESDEMADSDYKWKYDDRICNEGSVEMQHKKDTDAFRTGEKLVALCSQKAYPGFHTSANHATIEFARDRENRKAPAVFRFFRNESRKSSHQDAVLSGVGGEGEGEALVRPTEVLDAAEQRALADLVLYSRYTVAKRTHDPGNCMSLSAGKVAVGIDKWIEMQAEELRALGEHVGRFLEMAPQLNNGQSTRGGRGLNEVNFRTAALLRLEERFEELRTSLEKKLSEAVASLHARTDREPVDSGTTAPAIGEARARANSDGFLSAPGSTSGAAEFAGAGPLRGFHFARHANPEDGGTSRTASQSLSPQKLSSAARRPASGIGLATLQPFNMIQPSATAGAADGPGNERLSSPGLTTFNSHSGSGTTGKSSKQAQVQVATSLLASQEKGTRHSCSSTCGLLAGIVAGFSLCLLLLGLLWFMWGEEYLRSWTKKEVLHVLRLNEEQYAEWIGSYNYGTASSTTTAATKQGNDAKTMMMKQKLEAEL